MYIYIYIYTKYHSVLHHIVYTTDACERPPPGIIEQ